MRPPYSRAEGAAGVPPSVDGVPADRPSDQAAPDREEIPEGLSAGVLRRLLALSEENAQLKEAIAGRPVVDQARGVLMAVLEGNADDSWQVLQEASQRANVPLREVAAAVIASAAGEPLPEDLRVPVQKAINWVRWQRGNGNGPGKG